VELAKLAIELRPDDANHWNNLGVAQYRAGNWKAAVEALEKADAMLTGGDRVHRMFFAMAHWQLGDKQKARELYAQGAAWIAAHAQYSEGQARFRAEAEQLMKIAEEDRGRLVQQYLTRQTQNQPRPEDAKAWRQRAEAYAQLKQWDRAIEDYGQVIKLKPDDAEAWSQRAEAYAQLKQWEQAIASLRKALELDPKKATELVPKSVMAHANLGKALRDQGKLEEAVASYRKAIELDPKRTWLHTDLGSALVKAKKLEEAIASFRKAIEVDPKYADAHAKLGLALKDQGKPEEAIVSLRKAIEVDPKSANAHANLGLALKDQGKPEEAIACFRKAIELDPKSANAHAHLGLALKDQGKPEEAIASLRKAIELDPKLWWAYHGLARCLATADDVKLRNPKEAVELARKAIQLDPKPWYHWDTLSVAAYRAGDWKTSLDARQEKLQRQAAAAQDRLFLAMTHWQLGDKVAARKWYDEAIAELAKRNTTDSGLSNLRQEAKQLLGITTSAAPPDGGKPQPESPQTKADRR
jgi:tetratricopeptide (TPR) repeat protein